MIAEYQQFAEELYTIQAKYLKKLAALLEENQDG